MMKEDRKNLWVQAIKWPLYSVAIIPIIISGAFNLYLHNNISIFNFFIQFYKLLLPSIRSQLQAIYLSKSIAHPKDFY